MSDHLKNAPLGRHTDYIDTYTSSLLYPVPRDEARVGLGISLEKEGLPFFGVDVWHAYELSWLDPRGKPKVAMSEFRVPCDSKNIIESKSFKLYLNSFANTRFDSIEKVTAVLEEDLSGSAGSPVEVLVQSLEQAQRAYLMAMPGALQATGTLIDDIELDISQYEYAPELLMTEQGPQRREQLYSHLLRSRCPVTGQPDWATLIVRYTGEPISPASLLRYLVSLRNHDGFHEQIIERIYIDILSHCRPAQLTVYGRFTRRGGLDINPFRSNYETLSESLRNVRQ